MKKILVIERLGLLDTKLRCLVILVEVAQDTHW